MYNIGRLCSKIAGRDAGKQCVVVDVVNQHTVLVDGETRRKKVNVQHLEPLQTVLDLKKGASHEDVKRAFEHIGLKVLETKPKKKGAKPVFARTSKKTSKAAAKPKHSKKAATEAKE
ncbi:MAG TPA: 50S ribosomal protein L14e [Candidatus Nanoarchaeia archaeon]|nr:50S ribosomal protein L14e [Candidatus Nanoarchaeia archaeon]